MPKSEDPKGEWLYGSRCPACGYEGHMREVFKGRPKIQVRCPECMKIMDLDMTGPLPE